MGARGPAAKPTALRVLDGNPGKRPLNEREPQGTPGAPEMPDWLPARAKPFWGRLLAEAEPLGVLTHDNVFALAMLSDALAEWRSKAGRGKDVEGPMRRALALFTRFGLTPADRTKMRSLPEAVEDPLEAMLRGAR